MSITEKPLIIKTFIVLSILNCLGILIQFGISRSETFYEHFKSISYFGFFASTAIWIFFLLILKSYKQKWWIYLAYILYLTHSCAMLLLSGKLQVNTFLYWISPISLLCTTLFLVANFKVRAGELNDLFKVLAICLMAAGIIRMILPISLVYLQQDVVGIPNFNILTHILTGIAQTSLLFRWAKPKKEEDDFPPEVF